MSLTWTTWTLIMLPSRSVVLPESEDEDCAAIAPATKRKVLVRIDWVRMMLDVLIERLKKTGTSMNSQTNVRRPALNVKMSG